MVQFPITFTPTFPVEFGANTFRRLTFSRPIGMAEIFAAEGITDPVDQINAVTASLANVPVEVLTRMSIPDQLRLAETVAPIIALPPAAPQVA